MDKKIVMSGLSVLMAGSSVVGASASANQPVVDKGDKAKPAVEEKAPVEKKELSDAEVTAAVTKFKTDYKDLLSKAEVSNKDNAKINEALDVFAKLDKKVQAKLVKEKEILDAQRGALDKVAKDQENIGKAFKEKYKAILSKTPATLTVADEKIVTEAIDAFNKLTDKEQTALDAQRKQLVGFGESIVKAKKFLEIHKDALSKKYDTVKNEDLQGILKAIEDYNTLPSIPRDMLMKEYDNLNNMRLKFIEADNDFKDAKAWVAKYKALLDRDVKSIKNSDKELIDNAVDEYAKLSASSRELVKTERTKIEKMIVTLKGLAPDTPVKPIDPKLTPDTGKEDKKPDTDKKDTDKKDESKKDKDTLDPDKIVASKSAEAFRETHKAILAKEIKDVVLEDSVAIDTAIIDLSKMDKAEAAKLSKESEKLKAMSESINKLIIENRKMIVEKFKKDHSDILNKSVDKLIAGDLAAVEKAIADFDKLGADVQVELRAEKAKLDELLNKLKGSDISKDEEAIKAFRTKHKVILAKKVKEITLKDTNEIKAVADDFAKLTDTQKALLSVEKTAIETAQKRIEELKTSEKAIAKFKEDHKVILSKELKDVSSKDAQAVKSALDDFEKLQSMEKEALKNEKEKLNAFAKKLKLPIPGSENQSNSKDKQQLSTVEAFREKYKDILAKSTTGSATITDKELDKVNQALDEYDKMSDEDKTALKAEKEKLDALKKLTISRDKTKPSTGNTTTLFAAAGSGILATLGGIGYIFSKKSKDEDAE